MRHSLRLLLTLVIVALAIAAGTWLWRYYLYTPWTRDARIHAEVVTIAPDVSGWVHTLNVTDTDYVTQGDVLFEIDDTRYQTAVDRAQATVEHRQATLELSRAEESRRNQLRSSRAISAEDQQVAQINSRIAAADLNQSQADLISAQLDLERTQVTAPVSGHVLNVQFVAGNYVNRGTSVMALIAANSYYVVGYFEETKMASINVGDPVEIILMNGAPHLDGRVAGIGRGIADSNTTLNQQLLPQVAPTFNWVRLAQRIPVRISLDNVPDDTLLSVGMTATVRVHAAEQPE
ncbi:efflux RND transporter periplasmic adaptor subunit [Vreelandella alkaliphila]|uniref:HlyD family secretion protein n=1 Tax=Halomonas campaniensis TaxID=213554 RepID=A0A3D0KCF1_9GAMM|nr:MULTISPECIES: HlyD family secretion protein [unclassified Halomonas]HBS83457.1 HlyD family secretion protein [Halomonas campaniensis]ASK19730.1 efflux transporter periplasmic adaptor subunit [Halomonas sp. N3-2A]UTD53760.1 HlyD family secretion protein [Halomonas sp. MS1]WKD29162.1 HlyD family secretion protein [Halomonas sp. KG2]HCA00861.1 HlyD family secretion protein [Halomonas campaniensis]